MFCPILLILLSKFTSGEEYQGQYLGKFNTYAHQVTGEVYAVDEYTFLIRDFFYDGLGQDTFFWAGATVRPSNIGFIVPDEKGKTNILQRYVNTDISIRLADEKKIVAIKWLAVWDIRDHRNFADIYIPEGFEPPAPQRISEFSRISHGVKSDPVIIINSKTIKIPNFHYDGKGKHVYFYVGIGPQPNPSGTKIPDEQGYLDSLSSYDGEDIVLELSGNMTVFGVDWLGVWDTDRNKNLGSVLIPSNLNIPPSLAQIIPYKTRLPNCEQLHKTLQLHWEIFGHQVTFEIAAQIKDDEYIAIGVSGSPNSSQMIGSDISINYLDGHLGYSRDYNITARYPCTNVLGRYKGVCPDAKVGGIDNYQILTWNKENGITKLILRRDLETKDLGDLPFKKKGRTYMIWAIGQYNKFREPRYHRLFPRGEVPIEFGRKKKHNCFQFTQQSDADKIRTKARPKLAPWGPLRVFNQTATTFYARLGVPGGQRGYSATAGMASPGLVWYINGLMTPILFVKRGRSYTFRVEGGNNPQDTYVYHPMYLSNDRYGGYVKYSKKERKDITIYEGIEFDRKKRPKPTAAGRLCLWSYKDGVNPRKSDNYETFIPFRDSLNYTCAKSSPGLLQWRPNASTPDIVYYQSYTQRNMGFKIVVLDDFATAKISSSTSFLKASRLLLAVFTTFLIICNLCRLSL